jgi:hypothetical protein
VDVASLPGGAWNFGASIMTFAFPGGLFIVVAIALWVAYTKPEPLPGTWAGRPVSYTYPGARALAAEAAQARAAQAQAAQAQAGATGEGEEAATGDSGTAAGADGGSVTGGSAEGGEAGTGDGA